MFLFIIAFGGLVGGFLGRIVKKGVSGFWLGAFIGPIGWIIIFLLPRDQRPKKTKPTPRPKRDLESDAYKLWLGNKYKIQKHELFKKYEIDGAMFETLDEALFKADQQDRDQAIRREKGKEIKEKVTEEEARFFRNFIVPTIVIVTPFICHHILPSLLPVTSVKALSDT